MFNIKKISDKILDEIVEEKMQLRLKDNQVDKLHFTKVLNDGKFTKKNKEEMLEKLDEKIVFWRSRIFKYGFYSFIPTILLFLSISKVEFEINILGIKLSDIEKIKEFIFLLSISITVFISSISSGLTRLETIRDLVLEQIAGVNKFEIMRRTLASDIPGIKDGFDVILGVNKIWASRPRFAIQATSLFVATIQVIIFTMVFMWIQISIAYNIFLISNFGNVFGKTIAVVGILIFLWTLFHEIAREIYPFKYLDHEKGEYTSFFDKNTGELKLEIQDQILGRVSKRFKKVSMLITIGQIALALIAIFLISRLIDRTFTAWWSAGG